MKAKVLKYKFDGNTVVAPYMELEAYAEKHLSLVIGQERIRNENYDYFYVVCKVEKHLFLLRAVFQGNAWKGGTKRKNLSSIAKTGLRICFRMRKTGNHVSLFVDPCF